MLETALKSSFLGPLGKTLSSQQKAQMSTISMKLKTDIQTQIKTSLFQ